MFVSFDPQTFLKLIVLSLVGFTAPVLAESEDRAFPSPMAAPVIKTSDQSLTSKPLQILENTSLEAKTATEPSTSMSPKFLYYIGGGEPLSRNPLKTNFDYSFHYIRRLEEAKWTARYLFAGEQENSKKLRREVGTNSQPLTKETLAPFMKEIEDKIIAGQISNGQLMIYLDTHGVMENNRYTVSTIDGHVDILPQLIKIRSLAKDHGVKLAIIGATCYSGHLIDLEDENTCVLTTAPSDTVGLMMNNNTMAFLLGHQSADNLEDLHLKSRKFKDIELGQPLISTAAGKKAYEILKELRTTLLLAGKKSGYEINSCDQRGVEKTLKKLKGLLQDESAQYQSIVTEPVIEKLTQLDFKLKSILGQHRESLVSLLTRTCPPGQESLGQVCLFTEQKMTEQSTPTENDKSNILKPEERLPSSTNPKANQTFPPQTLEELVQTSNGIGTVERELYELLYKKFSEEQKGSNICQRFLTR